MRKQKFDGKTMDEKRDRTKPDLKKVIYGEKSGVQDSANYIT